MSPRDVVAAAVHRERQLGREVTLDCRPVPDLLEHFEGLAARTAVVAGGFAWIADRAELLALPASLTLALVLWLAFPVVLLTGSIIWERVPWQTAAIHAGDWLLKLVLVAVVLGLLH